MQIVEEAYLPGLSVSLVARCLGIDGNWGCDSQRPNDAGGEMDAAEEDGAGAVIARGEASAVPEAAEYALDGVAPLVKAAAEAAFTASIGFGPDVGNGSLLLNQDADAVGFIGAVRMDHAARRQAAQQSLGRSTVRGLTQHQVQGERLASRAGNGVDLGVAPTAADAIAWARAPPLWMARP